MGIFLQLLKLRTSGCLVLDLARNNVSFILKILNIRTRISYQYIYMYNKFYRIYKFVQRSIDIRMPPTAINNSKKNQNSHLIVVDW